MGPRGNWVLKGWSKRCRLLSLGSGDSGFCLFPISVPKLAIWRRFHLTTSRIECKSEGRLWWMRKIRKKLLISSFLKITGFSPRKLAAWLREHKKACCSLPKNLILVSNPRSSSREVHHSLCLYTRRQTVIKQVAVIIQEQGITDRGRGESVAKASLQLFG